MGMGAAGLQLGDQAAGAEEHGEFAEHTGSLRHHVRDHRVDLRSMSPRLRIITAVAVADLVASVVLLGVRDQLQPLVTIGGESGHQLALPLVVLIVGTAFFVLGLGYLLAGALHAHPLVGLLGVALVAYIFQPNTLDPFSLACGALLVLLFGFVLSCAVLDLHDARRHRTPRRLAQRIPSSVSIAFVAANCALAAGTFAWYGHPAAIGLGLKAVLTLIVTLAIPVFIMAGADLGEWAQLAAAQVGHTASRLHDRVLTGLVALALVATVAGAATSGDLNLPRSILPSAAFLLLVAALTWWPSRHHGHTEVPTRGLVIASLVYAAPFVLTALAPAVIGNALPSAANQSTYRHDEAPPFAVDHPADWHATPITLGTMTGVQLQAPARAAAVQVWVAPYTASGIAGPAVASLCTCTAEVVSSRLEGNVRDTVLTLRGSGGSAIGQVETWEHNSDGYSVLVLAGAGDQARFADHVPAFNSIREHLEVGTVSDPSLSVAQAQARDAQNQTMYRDSVIAVLLLLAGVTAWWLWRLARRQVGTPIAIVLVTVSAFFLLRYGPPQLAMFLGKDGGAFPAIDIQGLQIALGVAALVWLVVHVLRRREDRRRGLRALLALLVAVQVLGWLDGLYTASQKIGLSFRVLQAVLVLLAMLWELIMSGKSVTNGATVAFPRHARVLLFCGYSMTVATAVVVLSSLHLAGTGEALEPQFESDAWPQFGITFLGIPMVFAAFVLATRGSLRRGGALIPRDQPAVGPPVPTTR